MTDNLDWSQDPLVQLENAILPVLSCGQNIILDAMTSGEIRDQSSELEAFRLAIQMLQKKAADLLLARGIRAEHSALEPLKLAAKEVADLHGALQTALFAPLSTTTAKALLEQINSQMIPAIDAALNAYRKIFIGHVMGQQNAHAKQAKEAIGRLDKISKQIFFISINASVEAARVGEAGRGFTQISSDIRALSQSAQDATRSLSDLVQDT